jgi:hypothetical protein
VKYSSPGFPLKCLLPAFLALTAFATTAFVTAGAQTTRTATHLTPTGKGWGSVDLMQPPRRIWNSPRGTTSNGIYYHGGPVMPGTVNLYFIWYGNFVNGPAPSDSTLTEDLLTSLFGAGGLGASPYARINSTYSDRSRAVTGTFVLAEWANDYYSRGARLSDASVAAVVANAINSRALPKDSNGVYFVLTSSDVTETSGFCTQYCGWHGHASIDGADIKIAFVGNPDRCPNACVEQLVSPNADSGADSMASTIAHEINEAANDPDLNAWYDANGNESGDKCAWKWGPITGMLGNGGYNMTVGGRNWLIQMNWENARGGGCDLKLGGKFYNQ